MQDSFRDVKALQTTLFSKDSGGSKQSASDAAEDSKYRAAAKCKVESGNRQRAIALCYALIASMSPVLYCQRSVFISQLILSLHKIVKHFIIHFFVSTAVSPIRSLHRHHLIFA